MTGRKKTRSQRLSDDEKMWRHDGTVNGWSLPRKAHAVFRLPVIRNIRAIVARCRVETHYHKTAIGIRTGYDAWVLYAIYRGWC